MKEKIFQNQYFLETHADEDSVVRDVITSYIQHNMSDIE